MGDLCVACDRRARAGPRLRELNTDGSTFKNCESQIIITSSSAIICVITYSASPISQRVGRSWRKLAYIGEGLRGGLDS